MHRPAKYRKLCAFVEEEMEGFAPRYMLENGFEGSRLEMDMKILAQWSYLAKKYKRVEEEPEGEMEGDDSESDDGKVSH